MIITFHEGERGGAMIILFHEGERSGAMMITNKNNVFKIKILVGGPQTDINVFFEV